MLEKNPRYDFVIVSLKKAPEGRMFPPPLQALYKEIKLDDVVSIPQHPARGNPVQAGWILLRHCEPETVLHCSDGRD